MDARSPVLVLYDAGDADWAACLMLDLRARGVEIVDGRDGRDPAGFTGVDEPAAIVVVRSWFRYSGGLVKPSPELVEAVRARHGQYLVVRRNWTSIASDDYPGQTYRSPFNLWDDYYQPARGPTGKGDAGFAHLLGILGGRDAKLDLPPGYVFISYHFDSDGTFVHDRLRPVLSRAGLPSWAYRTSERIAEAERASPVGGRALPPSVRKRLEELVRGASVLLVVSTRRWWSAGADLEVRTARRHGIPVIAVVPPDVRPSGRAILAGVPSLTLDSDTHSADALVAALVEAGARPLAAP
jgi:hypothetical protein